jgi:16S rRNA G966 N2-methylase RsmD
VNEHILNSEVQAFLDEHLYKDLDRILFKGSPFLDIRVQELVEQIQSKRKCKTKLPTWYRTPGIYYPPKISVEQASSETAASYKASLVSGKNLADLSGGFGVDAYFFSKKVEQVHYFEINEELTSIAEHNFRVLGAGNLFCSNENSMQFLRGSNKTFDWIYLDPARRSGSRERVFLLEDCSPNILESTDLLLSRSDRVLLKLSPLLDISRAVNQLSGVEEVHVLAIDNEVKELLFLLGKDQTEKPIIHAVNIKGQTRHILSSEINIRASMPAFGPVRDYLYEPNAVVLKAGLFNEIAHQYPVAKLHPNSHLYTSEKLIDFPGRRFVVKKQMKYSPKKIRKELGLARAHVTTRNFFESVASIRKRTGLREGGDDYLFFTTDHSGRPQVLVCAKAD